MTDAMKATFEEVTVLGQTMLFIDTRIDPDTVPKGMYLYGVMHKSDDWDIPCQIADWVVVNHFGTLISNRPIKLTKHPVLEKSYRNICAEKDWNSEGMSSSLQEYMKKHPPRRSLHHER